VVKKIRVSIIKITASQRNWSRNFIIIYSYSSWRFISSFIPSYWLINSSFWFFKITIIPSKWRYNW
jgi:hypothetical protein